MSIAKFAKFNSLLIFLVLQYAIIMDCFVSCEAIRICFTATLFLNFSYSKVKKITFYMNRYILDSLYLVTM